MADQASDSDNLTQWEVDHRRWAVEVAHGDIDHAERLVDFVLGRSARTPMDKIKEALAEAGIT